MLGISHKFPLRKNKAKLSELWAINIWGLGLKAQIDNNDTVQMKMTIVLNGADLMPNNGLNLCDWTRSKKKKKKKKNGREIEQCGVEDNGRKRRRWPLGRILYPAPFGHGPPRRQAHRPWQTRNQKHSQRETFTFTFPIFLWNLDY